MSIQKSTWGDDFIREDNIHPVVPKSGYTAALGDLVTRDNTLDNCVDACAVNERIWGIVLSLNGDGTVLSVAELKDGCRIVLPYISAPSIGDAVESDNSRASSGITNRGRVQTDNTNGVGRVIGVDSSGTTIWGAGHCLVEFRAWPKATVTPAAGEEY